MASTVIPHENPTPAEEIDADSAQQRAQREGGSRPPSPDADRRGLVCFIEHGIDQRQRARHEERRTQALNEARGDQHRR
jgi:hypothetical protein